MALTKAEIICYLVAVIGFFAAHVVWQASFWMLYLAVGCAAILAYVLNRKLEQKRPPTTGKREKYVSPYKIEFTDQEVTVTCNGTEQKGVAWDDLIYVGIRIESEGFFEVPYWLFGGTKGSCFFSSDAVGGEKVIDELERHLKDIDFRAIAEAMGSLSGGWTVWEKPDSNRSNLSLDTDGRRRQST